MRSRRSMTVLAPDARRHFVEMQFVGTQAARGMASEAIASVALVHASPERLHNIRRDDVRGAHREIECANIVEVAHAAFVIVALVLQHVCLAGGAKSKRPSNRLRNGLIAVSNGVDALVTLANDLVPILAALECELLVVLQNWSGRRVLQRI